MKLFLLEIEFYEYEEGDCNTYVITAIYSSFEKAKIGGVDELKRKFVEAEGMQEENFNKLLADEKIDYNFTITEITDLEYTENFNIHYDLLNDDKYLKLEPTHKINYLDYKGNIKDMIYEYRIKNLNWRTRKSIRLYPEDLEEGASDKFKIGDIVKLKHDIDYKYKDDNTDRIYIVRWLPRKFNGEKYFENKYALISLYENESGNKELFTFEYFERDIEKYDKYVERDSEYDLLSRIVKGELKVKDEFWRNVKIGELPLNVQNVQAYRQVES